MIAISKKTNVILINLYSAIFFFIANLNLAILEKLVPTLEVAASKKAGTPTPLKLELSKNIISR